MVTGWDTFCEALEGLTGSETERELNFTSKITMRMIKQAINTRWPVGRLPWIVRNAFPESLHRPMLDMITENRDNREDSGTQGKRLLEDVTEMEGNSKRSKLYTADITMS